ncbi:uncharacterized protein LOC128854203 [Cuculus canorus]|uniref:uncharacterized protein LOC128854203 n=1 Tax=Cuculus canorus TaxID=55661 RepID=UPI0023AA6028|nr:uncharacterized protein LOC128854203 [Cuculus canorus]
MCLRRQRLCPGNRMHTLSELPALRLATSPGHRQKASEDEGAAFLQSAQRAGRSRGASHQLRSWAVDTAGSASPLSHTVLGCNSDPPTPCASRVSAGAGVSHCGVRDGEVPAVPHLGFIPHTCCSWLGFGIDTVPSIATLSLAALRRNLKLCICWWRGRRGSAEAVRAGRGPCSHRTSPAEGKDFLRPGDGAQGAPNPAPAISTPGLSVCPARTPARRPRPSATLPFPAPVWVPPLLEQPLLSVLPERTGESLAVASGLGRGGGRRLAFATGKSLSPGAERPRPVRPVGGEPSPGRGAPTARCSREEGKAEARLLVRTVIFHQSPAICVSAPDRTPAVLLAEVTETTQRWRRANCICSPALRSKLRPSHGAGKGAKGPCDMREI